MADVEAGKPIFHDSGSSLHHHPSASGHLQDDPAAAKCWDIPASDIVICERPDGSDWLLSSSESGQVQSQATLLYCSVMHGRIGVHGLPSLPLLALVAVS